MLNSSRAARPNKWEQSQSTTGGGFGSKAAAVTLLTFSTSMIPPMLGSTIGNDEIMVNETDFINARPNSTTLDTRISGLNTSQISPAERIKFLTRVLKDAELGDSTAISDRISAIEHLTALEPEKINFDYTPIFYPKIDKVRKSHFHWKLAEPQRVTMVNNYLGAIKCFHAVRAADSFASASSKFITFKVDPANLGKSAREFDFNAHAPLNPLYQFLKSPVEFNNTVILNPALTKEQVEQGKRLLSEMKIGELDMRNDRELISIVSRFIEKQVTYARVLMDPSTTRSPVSTYTSVDVLGEVLNVQARLLNLYARESLSSCWSTTSSVGSACSSSSSFSGPLLNRASKTPVSSLSRMRDSTVSITPERVIFATRNWR